MRLPDFLIIGAAKSSTTTLYKYLCRHPQIYMSTPKELDFFAIDDIYARGIDWYSLLFSEAGLEQVCGEASTTYTRLPKFPKAAARIAQTLPKVKMIYIIRHPVDRAYSHHVHEIKCREQKPNTTFEEGIKERSYLVESSDYMKHLEQYLAFFPKEHFLIILMDDLIDKPADTMEEVCRFLGVNDKIDLVENSPIVANQARRAADGFVRSKMTSPLRAIPGAVFIANLLPQWVRDLVYQVLKALPHYRKWGEQQSYLPPQMLPETRQMLLEKFREPNLRLAEFINRDLSHWNH